jgi:hypothetical protein
MTMKVKLVSGIATGALLLGAFAPAAFAATTTVTISGNGNKSNNTTVVVNKHKNKIKQANFAAVLNLTGVVLSTGGNKANNNTGDGNVNLTSGSATSTVTNNTTIGGNVATAQDCGCDSGSATLKITGNGSNSTNTAVVVNKTKSSTTQFNGAFVLNGTYVVESTGGNKANGNTGDGDVTLTSGDATSDVTNTTIIGGNILQ